MVRNKALQAGTLFFSNLCIKDTKMAINEKKKCFCNRKRNKKEGMAPYLKAGTLSN